MPNLYVQLIMPCVGLAMVGWVIYTVTTPHKPDPNAPLDPESQKLKDELDALSRAVDGLERSADAKAPPADPLDPLVEAPKPPDREPPPSRPLL